jgi:prepilin signal peptidase PulO-like enzyme (type II secretory pathway)
MLAVVVWGFIFACAATCGVVAAHLLCANIEAPEGGPVTKPLHPAFLIVGFALFGLLVAARGADVQELGIVALVGVPLMGAWYSDTIKGIVPDAFTLVPLAIVIGMIIWRHTWWVGFSMAVVFAAFAMAAWFSKGRGMGWGDAKLAALCGALLGLQAALFMLAVACLAATGVAVIRSRGKQPVAFAPYIIAAIFVDIFFTAHA